MNIQSEYNNSQYSPVHRCDGYSAVGDNQFYLTKKKCLKLNTNDNISTSIIFSGSTPNYHYFVTDHLGNVRQVMSSTGIIEEKNDYYPFGLRHNRSNYQLAAGNKYKYNGKEQEQMEGLLILDYGVRLYDPALARWHVPDPMAELGKRWSPYNYAFNNPMRFIDTDCMWPKWGQVLDVVQTGLDVADIIPVVGNITDLANTGISVARGDYVGAGLSLAATVPFAVIYAGTAKTVKGVTKIANETGDVSKVLNKNRNVGKELNFWEKSRRISYRKSIERI